MKAQMGPMGWGVPDPDGGDFLSDGCSSEPEAVMRAEEEVARRKVSELPVKHEGPPEPMACPECNTIVWVAGHQTKAKCPYCRHEWQARASSVTVHRFECSGSAYDMSQCDESIHNGDVLVVESEKAVAILIEAWPVAIDNEHAGEFHAMSDPATFDWENIAQTTGQVRDYSESLKVARAEAEKF